MYIVTFADGSTWKGGTPLDSHWNEMPKKPIVKLQYGSITLSGYEAYNHIREYCKIWGMISGKIKDIKQRILLMVKKGNEVLIIQCDLNQSPVGYDIREWGKERKVGKGCPYNGWKEGIKNGKPKTETI